MTSDSAPRARAPAVSAEPGWEPIEPLRVEGGRGSFVSGDPEGETLRVAYFRRQGDQRLVGRAWFGPGAAGPPGHAHGGSMAAVLDEAMGAAAWRSGHPSLAVHLATDFRRLLPLGTDTFLEAWVERVEGQKVITGGRLHDGRGGDFAAARGVFVRLRPERDRGILERVAATLGKSVEELDALLRDRRTDSTPPALAETEAAESLDGTGVGRVR